MKNLFNMLQWAALIALVFLLVRSLTRPIPEPDYDPGRWNAWQGFYAISYAGVTRRTGPDYVTSPQLASHLHALREAGYKTITPEDVEAFLDGRSPLPERALLILFEGGRKDSLVSATPLLRQFGQMATMCIPTSLTRGWGSFYIKATDVRKFLKDPHWSIASMGHTALKSIPVADKQQGRFLVRRRWLGNREETAEEYRARIEADFAEAARILDQAARRPVAAYLFPYADMGISPGAAPEAEDVLRSSVGAHHRVAFSRADDAFNGPESDPLQLTRLRVRGDWSADDLLDALAKAEPRSEPAAHLGGEANWSITGEAAFTGDSLTLSPGSRAWLRGSSDWSDAEFAARVDRTDGGTVDFYLRYAGPTRYLRLHIDNDGIRAQERIGRTMQTLAFYAASNGAPTRGEVRVKVKGNRMWVEADRKPLGDALPLTQFTTRGRLGIEAGTDPVILRSFSAHKFAGLLVVADAYRSLPAALRVECSHWMAPWFTADKPPVFSANMRSELLAAGAEGVHVIPKVSGSLTEADALVFADQLAGQLTNTVARGLLRCIALAPECEALGEPLRQRGFTIFHEADARHAKALIETKRLGRDADFLLLYGSPLEGGEALAQLQREMPSSRIFWMTDSATYLPAGVRRATKR